jgi:hypothetical protein
LDGKEFLREVKNASPGYPGIGGDPEFVKHLNESGISIHLILLVFVVFG